MSFKKKTGEPLKFEDTYLGYSDEEEDAFNDATFGNDIPLGQDFNFGGPSSSASNPPPQTINYADAAKSKPQQLSDDALLPMESLWGGPSTTTGSQQPLSVDQIEAQLTQQPPLPQQGPPSQVLQQQFPQAYPQPFFYPPEFIQRQQGPPIFPPQFNLNQIPPQQFAQLPPEIQQQLIHQAQFAQHQAQFPPDQFQQQPPSQGQQQKQQQQPLLPHQHQAPQLQLQTSEDGQQNHVQQNGVPQSQDERQLEDARHHPDIQQSKPDLSQFPVLGSDEANSLRAQNVHRPELAQQQLQQQHHHHHQQQQQQQHRQHGISSNGHSGHHHQNNRNHRGGLHHENFKDLPEEEQARLIRRHQKVQRILQFSGIMTPRDKDFISRIQLSQIVTDDPYNEDFYFQVFRLLKTGDHNVSNNSIAQNYLNFSGHKLGGRHQRADLALHRMQQQVQKAVAAAKERPRNTQLTKEGALGKVSFVSGKRPRKQLEIVGNKPELPEITKVGKKASLALIEEIYQQVLLLESEEREKRDGLNSEALWESLKVYDSAQQSNQFIQTLSYEKGLKIFPRIFHFLSRQQRLTVVTLIFANLSLIKVITNSSFKNHENDEIPSSVQKTIDLFQWTVLKTIIHFLSTDASLDEIIGFLTILVEHNNVSFLSTSKLGILLLTILLSRAEIIQQEQPVSNDDLQLWSNAYESLFSSLENKLPLIFPATKASIDDSYIWQFLASLSLGGKINHQRIIVDEIRDEIFGSMGKAKESLPNEKNHILTNLNTFLNVIGLSANEDDIVEIK